MKRIVIISGNERLRDFFALEAMTFGFSVERFEKFEKKHNDLSSYDLAVIDKDTVKQTPLNTAKKEIIVSSSKGKADVCYPLSIKELRDIYVTLFFGEDVSKKDDDDQHRIIFYSSEKNIVSLRGRKYLLSDSEYKLLELLCKSPRQTVLRERIDELFENGKSNLSDVYVCKLRKKLEDPLGERLIFTVREKGYYINTDAEWR